MDNRTEILSSEALAARAEALGVPLSKLATEAGLAASTASRWKTGGATDRNLRAVQRVLEARERALLRSLMRLHPDLVEDAA
jgi:transcriptional regulator with XRE-family HTH domain